MNEPVDRAISAKRKLLPLLLTVAVALTLAVGLTTALVWQAPPVHAQDVNATFSVAHFAPFSTTLTETSVTVRVNGSDAITELIYGEVVPNIPVPAGVYTVEVIPTGSITPVYSTTADLMAGTEYLVAAVGDGTNYPVSLYPLVIDRTPISDSSKLRITHLAPFAAPSEATGIDICSDAGAVVLPGLIYLETSDYLQFAPGIYDLKVAISGTNCADVVLDLPPVSLRAGQVADVIARGLVGEGFDPALALSVYTDLAARVSLAHFAPFAPPPFASTAVTVQINGIDMATGLTFGDFTGYVSMPPGDYSVQIIPTGTVTAAISSMVTLPDFRDYTVAAIGDGVNQTLSLTVLTDANVTRPTSGTARLMIAHLAPLSNTVAGTQIDLCISRGDEPVLDDLPYGAQDYTVLTPSVGLFSSFIATGEPDCDNSLLNLAPVVLNEGDAAYIYVIGGVNGWPLFVIEDTVFGEDNLLERALIKYMPILFGADPEADDR